MATYTSTSPYYKTQMWGKYLDVWSGVTITPDPSDALYQIDSVYNGRPDILAFDMYKDSNLWWVFAVRNPDVIRDPLRDFQTGTIIYVPTFAVVKTALGI